jgi:hypothetical protein
MAYDVDVSARRLGNYAHVLRELVHLSCGHLALEPRFDVKALLGDHLHDDARAVSKLQRRLRELNADPGGPSEELAALLDRANTADTGEYLEIAYGTLKPTLIAALRIHLANLDPLVDEPGLRLVTQVLHRQERHVAELPAASEQIAFEDLGALELRTHEQRALKVMDPLDRPARDAFVEVADAPPHRDGRQGSFHALMDAALCAAELTARNSHEHPDMPWDFHVDMARQTWDEIRHAEIFDRLMATELGCHWGDYPVAFGDFRSVYARDLAGRLAVYDAISEQLAQQRNALAGQDELARVFDQLLADEDEHARSAARWRS